MEDGEKDGFTLTSDEHEFIEAMGLHFEDEGIPRIGGRILGLLILVDRPLSLGRIAELLKVSPASVSTNVRNFHTKALVKEISFPGDRRHYYVFSDSSWDSQILAAKQTLENAEKIYRHGLSRVAADNPVRRQRMSEACEFFGFVQGVLQSAIEQWRERRKAPPGSSSTG